MSSVTIRLPYLVAITGGVNRFDQLLFNWIKNSWQRNIFATAVEPEQPPIKVRKKNVTCVALPHRL